MYRNLGEAARHQYGKEKRMNKEIRPIVIDLTAREFAELQEAGSLTTVVEDAKLGIFELWISVPAS
jgi:hypothetical protein